MNWTCTGPITSKSGPITAPPIGPVEYRCVQLYGPNTNCQYRPVLAADIGTVLGQYVNVCWEFCFPLTPFCILCSFKIIALVSYFL